MAIIEGHEKVVSVLISNGVTGFPPGAEIEEYEGLDIGGQKSTWALEHRKENYDESEKIQDAPVFITAAYFNQTKMIEYFLKEGKEIWEAAKLKFGKRFEQYDGHFQLNSTYNGFNVIHCAVINHSMDSLKMLIEYDRKFSKKEELLINMGDDDGVTPLMTSVSDEEWIEATKLLIAAGANLEAIDKKSGWNALHFAVAFHNTEAIQLLLQHMNRDQGKQLSYTIFI
jgi:ankyrin repeat protein